MANTYNQETAQQAGKQAREHNPERKPGSNQESQPGNNQERKPGENQANQGPYEARTPQK
eukprot:8309868-Pyramimonas_sp.AAC.1